MCVCVCVVLRYCLTKKLIKMKQFFNFALVSVLSVVLFSCSSDNVEGFSSVEEDLLNSNSLVEELKNDIRFIEYLKLNHEMLANPNVKINDIEIYLEKEVLSETDTENLVSAMGFSDLNAYIDHATHLDNLLKELNEEYQLFEIEDDLITDASYEVLTTQYQDIEPLSLDDCFCSRLYDNCVKQATANAAVMHIGCGVLDVSVVIGLGCHAAVFVYHTAAIDDCAIEKILCIEQCNKNKK